jgi:hypothetical protein
MRDGGHAPYLDYRPPTSDEVQAIDALLDDPWLASDLERVAVGHAASTLAPKHLAEVHERTDRLVDRTISAVHDRLTHEINYWDLRFVNLQEDEVRGKRTRLSSEMARRRRDDLQRRLEERTNELQLQKRLAPRKPVLKGAMLVVSANMLSREADYGPPFADNRRRIELVAMEAVMRHERVMGNEPRDVSRENVGYDIESRMPSAPPGTLRLIEVKGRVAGARTVTVTRNEILTAKNSPERWFLAIVEVDGKGTDVTYLAEPFRDLQDPDFSVASINFVVKKLAAAATE